MGLDLLAMVCTEEMAEFENITPDLCLIRMFS
jgi:hypothetical protein